MLSRIRTRLSQIEATVRLGLITAVVILFIVFLLQNTGETHVKFLVFEEDVPTIVLILVTTVGGFTAGYLIGLTARRRRRRQAQKQQQAE